MDDVTRRDALGAAAFAGAVALAGIGSASAADEPLKGKADDAAEKKRVMAAGLTEAEADCWIAASKAAGLFFELPKLHALDDQEVATAIHVLQHKILSRPVYRKYLEIAKSEQK